MFGKEIQSFINTFQLQTKKCEQIFLLTFLCEEFGMQSERVKRFPMSKCKTFAKHKGVKVVLGQCQDII